jgi:hypothetical protein
MSESEQLKSKIDLRQVLRAALWAIAALAMFAVFKWCCEHLPHLDKSHRPIPHPHEKAIIGGAVASFCAAFVMVAEAMRTLVTPHDRH